MSIQKHVVTHECLTEMLVQLGLELVKDENFPLITFAKVLELAGNCFELSPRDKTDILRKIFELK